MDKLDFIEIKSSCTLKDTFKDMKSQAMDQVKILTLYVHI